MNRAVSRPQAIASGSDIATPMRLAADWRQDPHRSANKSGSVCLCCQRVALCWFCEVKNNGVGQMTSVRPRMLRSGEGLLSAIKRDGE
ncbi:hypothetical protein E5345_05825 [Propionibacterium sp. NM47_B9-13]|nr:hypothetical protein CP877_03980 [Cutibacterium modestum]TGY29507.1 hypothetical protein E5345_05825 [Propionibacterium sp. NM47_B9-13]